MSRLREWARELKRQTLVVYFAARDPRTPWLARLLALGIAAYALSPIDLIPDFIPVLGYLDDLVIVPLGLMLVLRLVPTDVLASSQAKAEGAVDKPTSPAMAAVIVAIWVIAIVALGLWARQALRA
ncbi:YkvA family protein [Pseudoxanthomonas sp. CF125]|uniref:YkvA family protein n=1 Tax=Pseudoxanthomonas sp. CF125 TaxID=1855303 RepID=UPI00088D060D|nr:YkvA family protein [Pseudoxanthomonas sp. CF125]SDR10293.1 Uncharacterized membrane protein YkvA, DUF1232 family [Pseudoxanthomonas sp. CF125]HVK51438.1 YkvA family protein [Pseudoxanthomonas sp.]